MNRRENVVALSCGLAGEVVRTFGEVRLRVFGTSMVPSILPGDLISIQRAGVSEISSGEIVLYVREGRMFAHRVVACTGSPEGSLLITRGDRLRHNDPPVSSSELLGRVTSIQRGDRQFEPLAQAIGSNYPLVRLLQTSDYATYFYLRLAVLWGRFAGRSSTSLRIKSLGRHSERSEESLPIQNKSLREILRAKSALRMTVFRLFQQPVKARNSLAKNAGAKASAHKADESPDESVDARLRTEDTEGVVECQA